MNLYSSFLRPLLFRLDAETAHHQAMRLLEVGSRVPWLVRAGFGGGVPVTPRKVFGLDFRNPIGLAAGMDKNAVALPAWEALGFGFVEIGTVTAKAQPGNPSPRMFRYPAQKALINRMGFNNDGAEVVARRLEQLKESGRWPLIPVGVNIGKSKVTPLEEAAEDYLISFQKLMPYADYFVVNVSSPNTPGLRQLQDSEALKRIVSRLRDSRDGDRRPILVKLAPDLEIEPLQEAVEVATSAGAAGFIATNTTLDHRSVPEEKDEQGGLSGAPLRAKSTATLQALISHTSLPVIASGGVMDRESAREKFLAGASLVQVYTGLVYRGPGLIREIMPR